MIKNIYKFRTLIYSFICVLIVISYTLMNLTNDGMNNDKSIKLYYKTYSNRWTFYSRDGLISGNKKNIIKNINFKIRCNKKCGINYNKKKDNIVINLDSNISKKYVFCYRKYNKKWSKWYCDNNIKLDSFTAFEAKIIPKNVEKKDWLRK